MRLSFLLPLPLPKTWTLPRPRKGCHLPNVKSLSPWRAVNRPRNLVMIRHSNKSPKPLTPKLDATCRFGCTAKPTTHEHLHPGIFQHSGNLAIPSAGGSKSIAGCGDGLHCKRDFMVSSGIKLKTSLKRFFRLCRCLYTKGCTRHTT